ncbi:DEAD-box ATP-dependent RNA helicase 7 [Dorcoceras hygrometricum]|uniref:DEAD-box ATP-dependent RNA helicase 7 n=1 Tax=Dorcoceras hygrometricum TaxID=472368 RepID=A0A2Z7C888_9LAMI|nr:DEAD-box ATP-dependent RNA helicase 7 [Dorcoceras hygrometricum]
MTDSEDTEPLSKDLEITDKSKSDEESMSIEDILKQIPEVMMLPSLTAAKITRIKFGHGIEIPGVNEGDWYKASLPRIATSDKGKVSLVAKDEIKGNLAREMFSLICADIDFLVHLREKVITDVASFFHSFSLRRLPVFDSIKDIIAKEEQILAWADTDSLETAVRRREYIIAKYREMILRKFLEAHLHNFKSGQPTTAIDLQIIAVTPRDF